MELPMLYFNILFFLIPKLFVIMKNMLCVNVILYAETSKAHRVTFLHLLILKICIGFDIMNKNLNAAGHGL